MSHPFSDLELDALCELMNTGVGKSARSLSELISRHVRMSVPVLKLIEPGDLNVVASQELQEGKAYAIARQEFFGPIRGTGIFFLAQDECLSIAHMIGLSPDLAHGVITDLMEELTNLMLVSCAGFIASTLGQKCSFSSPEFYGMKNACDDACDDIHTIPGALLSLRTAFTFVDSESDGQLVLIIASECLEWLKTTLDAYIENLQQC